jgi:hypothetical protein
VTCLECGNRIYPQRCSVKSKHKHGGRGLCQPCYGRATRQGYLNDCPRLTVSSAERTKQWLDMKERGWTRTEAAAQMGISLAALEQAITRHNRATRTPRLALASSGRAENKEK